MSITNYKIAGSGRGVKNTEEEARAAAFDELLSNLFSKLHEILSRTFTRVKENTKKFDTGNYTYYRESYALNGNEKQYLIVEIYIASYACSSSDESILINFMQSNTPFESNTTDSYLDKISTFYTVVNRSYSQRVIENEMSITEHTYDLSTSFHAINLCNENLSLFTICVDANKKNLINCIGKCVINDKSFFVHTGYYPREDITYFILCDIEGNLYYTNNEMIKNHNGVDVDGYVVTLPVYLTMYDRENGVILKDYKLEGVLQTTLNSCEAGSIYKIDGEDYFSMKNMLVKL